VTFGTFATVGSGRRPAIVPSIVLAGEAGETVGDREFGPNTARVEELLSSLSRSDWGTVAALAAARPEPGDRAATHAARAAGEAIAASGRTAAARDARRIVADWAMRWVRASVGPVTFETAVLATFASRDRALAELAGRALPVVLDAVSALVVADLLDPYDFDVLYGPWASVVDGGVRIGPGGAVEAPDAGAHAGMRERDGAPSSP
jgi:hypothetical protein